MEITLEEIQKKFENLPEDLKWAIMAANVDDKIIEIGQANGLNVEQIGQLSLETHMVMFGFTHPDKFERSVEGSLGLPDEKIKSIVNAVNEKILKEIRKQMMKSTEEEKKKPEEITPPEPVKPKIPNMIMPNPVRSRARDSVASPSDRGTATSNGTHPILAEKLTGSFQVPATNTEHTLENLSKTKELPSGTSTTEIPKPSAPASYPPSKDPYRLSPEE